MNRITSQQKKVSWHAPGTEATLKEVASQIEALSQKEVSRRLKAYGANRLRPPQKQTAWHRFVAQFHNVLIYVLLGSAGVTAFWGHWVDTSVILGVVIINTFIGFIQEGKAEKAMDAIRKMLSVQAIARRDGVREQVPAQNLVPGDMFFL